MSVATGGSFTGLFPSASLRGGSVATMSAQGGWSWYSDPRTLRHGGVLYWGYVRGTDGSVVVAALDEATETLTETVIASAFEVDDHALPSLLIRASDQRIMAFYASHFDTTIRYRISTDPLDISAWDAEQEVTGLVAGTYTYTMPVQLSGEAGTPIRLFYRTRVTADSSDPELHYSLSDDDGATWGSAVRLHDLQYTKLAATASRIHFLCSEHPNSGQTSVFHFYLDTGDGTLHRSDGAVISASLPLQSSGMTLVYDGSSEKGWVWDLAMDGDTPVGVIATFPGNDGSAHTYRHARWTSSAWSVHPIVDAGGTIATEVVDANPLEVYYSGGIAIDRNDPRIVYASVQSGSDWEMRRYFTKDGGATWTATTIATGAKDIRPAAVYGAPGEPRVLWLRGTYHSYVDFDVGTFGWPT